MSTPTNDADDADALFGNAFGTPAPAPAAAAGGLPSVGEGADNRKEPRYKVSWPARVQLPDGRVVELRVRDLSDHGVGFVMDVSIPAYTVLYCAIGVPGIEDPRKISPVTGSIKTAYMIVQGRDIYCGGTWVALPDDARELLQKWIRRLRGR